ncbi:DNA-binding protein REB1 isoform X2 [Magnolia sinica]|uniref:DNA-binding protein REB1 isoform X2 n=1 Tax=Magnolia sinica TaxID=86752 RepID=UPI002657B175|nr:DNA-binding protein REB1 isoform X2 [Magnolia sinica]
MTSHSSGVVTNKDLDSPYKSAVGSDEIQAKSTVDDESDGNYKKEKKMKKKKKKIDGKKCVRGSDRENEKDDLKMEHVNEVEFQPTEDDSKKRKEKKKKKKKTAVDEERNTGSCSAEIPIRGLEKTDITDDVSNHRKKKIEKDGQVKEQKKVKKMGGDGKGNRKSKGMESVHEESPDNGLDSGGKSIGEYRVAANDNAGDGAPGKKKKKGIAKHDADDGAASKKKRKRDVEDNVGDGVSSKKKRKRDAEANADHGVSSKKKRKKNADDSTKSRTGKQSRRVSFSDKVEVFPLPKDARRGEETSEEGLVQGKRFTPEEDEMVREAVLNYVKVHDLGENGLDMVLNIRRHPKLKGCFKEIGCALPWRPYMSVYHRAHILFEGDGNHKWSPKEYDILRKHHEKHGADWKPLAVALGKHRFHIKDAWRRIKLTGTKRGPWSQEEYQTLFDLVNMDLCMKAFEEKKTKHGMLRDNIAWEAISEKLSTRNNVICCLKWLIELDACCVEDVDWDNLLDHRDGDLCLKRWNQMTKHIGGYKDKPFAEQVELLSKRYCPNLLEFMEHRWG